MSATGQNPTHTFAGNPLDRLTSERRDEAWLAAHRRDPASRVLPLWRLQVPIVEDSPARLGWGGPALLEQAHSDRPAILLGTVDGVAHYAVDVSHLEDPAPALVDGAAFSDVRAAAPRLAPAETGIVAQSKAQVDWHARHQFCPNCGSRTDMRDAGLMRKCDGCGAEHFPRTDPVVIVVVSDGERCLLGRQKSWPPGMFSALAGFVDQGEAIEEAVRREVMEEAGISVGKVRYHSSQPWPFPSSLMIGCLGEALSDQITVDEAELDTAKWFTREQALLALRDPANSPDLGLPPPMAIAHQIVKAWAEGERP